MRAFLFFYFNSRVTYSIPYTFHGVYNWRKLISLMVFYEILKIVSWTSNSTTVLRSHSEETLILMPPNTRNGQKISLTRLVTWYSRMEIES